MAFCPTLYNNFKWKLGFRFLWIPMQPTTAGSSLSVGFSVLQFYWNPFCKMFDQNDCPTIRVCKQIYSFVLQNQLDIIAHSGLRKWISPYKRFISPSAETNRINVSFIVNMYICVVELVCNKHIDNKSGLPTFRISWHIQNQSLMPKETFGESTFCGREGRL